MVAQQLLTRGQRLGQPAQVEIGVHAGLQQEADGLLVAEGASERLIGVHRYQRLLGAAGLRQLVGMVVQHSERPVGRNGYREPAAALRVVAHR